MVKKEVHICLAIHLNKCNIELHFDQAEHL